jgi:pimeloyl-ACP methyl ester carboxylesterase
MLNKIGMAILAIAFALAAIVASAVAFFPPQRPPPIHATTEQAIAEMAGGDLRAAFADLPPLQHMRARDGEDLAYRFYAGAPGGGVAVLVHGSSASSQIMHLAAKALSRAGITVIAPDMRGHGESGARQGDIDYMGQLDDDMADMAAMIARRFPGERKLLIGHSSGGSFALRVAGGPGGEAFDGYVALSPFLNARSSTARPRSGGWAGVSLPRILGLVALNVVGIHAFDGLPTLAFAIDPASHASQVETYSFRLMSNFGLPQRGWEARLAAIQQPTIVIVAGEDELFRAEAFAPALRGINPRLDVRIAPGVGHMGLVVTPAALEALAAAARDVR